MQITTLRTLKNLLKFEHLNLRFCYYFKNIIKMNYYSLFLKNKIRANLSKTFNLLMIKVFKQLAADKIIFSFTLNLKLVQITTLRTLMILLKLEHLKLRFSYPFKKIIKMNYYSLLLKNKIRANYQKLSICWWLK